MNTKRKMSFGQHIKFAMPHANVADYAKKAKLTNAEKRILADYMNGHIAITILTAPMLTKMRLYSNTKYQFDRAYALELTALNLSERPRATLNKMYKESTLKNWLSEFSLISNDMQHVYADEFGVSIYENSNLHSVKGIVQKASGKGRKAAEVVQQKKDLDLLRDTVAKKEMAAPCLSHEEMDDDDMMEEETDVPAENYSEAVRLSDETTPTDPKPNSQVVESYFSPHVLKRWGSDIRNQFNEMIEVHGAVADLFKEFARSPLCAYMADFWWSSFKFEMLDESREPAMAFRVSCKHFTINMYEDRLEFVDKWDLGEVVYKIPTSDKQPDRLNNAEYFLQVFDYKRLNKILRHIGFEHEDGLMSAGKPINLSPVESGAQAIMCMNKTAKPIGWESATFTFYDLLGHMKDGVRGCTLVLGDNDKELTINVLGMEFDAMLVSVGAGGSKRFVMTHESAQQFFAEFTDHMGFSDGVDELRNRGFALDLNRERAVLSFNDDTEKHCEVIAYV